MRLLRKTDVAENRYPNKSCINTYSSLHRRSNKQSGCLTDWTKEYRTREFIWAKGKKVCVFADGKDVSVFLLTRIGESYQLTLVVKQIKNLIGHSYVCCSDYLKAWHRKQVPLGDSPNYFAELHWMCLPFVYRCIDFKLKHLSMAYAWFVLNKNVLKIQPVWSMACFLLVWLLIHFLKVFFLCSFSNKSA